MSINKLILENTYEYFLKLKIDDSNDCIKEIINALLEFQKDSSIFNRYRMHLAPIVVDEKKTGKVDIGVVVSEYIDIEVVNNDIGCQSLENSLRIKESLNENGIYEIEYITKSGFKSKIYSENDSGVNERSLIDIVFDKFIKMGVVESSKVIDIQYRRKYIRVSQESCKIIFPTFRDSLFLIWSSSSIASNVKWDIELLKIMRNNVHWDFISSNKYIFWDFEITNEFKDNINWGILSQKYNVTWSPSFIEKFKDYIEWDKLIKNESVKWSIDLLLEFSSYLNWRLVSSSIFIKWNLENIDKVADKLDFKILGGNRNLIISFDLLKKYNEKIIIDYGATMFEWNLNILKEFKPWIFKSHHNTIPFLSKAVINEDIIMYYENLMDQVVQETHYVHRNSDGYRDYEVRRSYWDYLSHNENMIWTDNLFKRYIEKLEINKKMRLRLSIECIELLWNYEQQPYYHFLEDYDGYSKLIPSISFKDILRNCEIVNLDFDTFKRLEVKWWNYLISDSFINESIRDMLVRYFTNTKEGEIGGLDSLQSDVK